MGDPRTSITAFKINSSNSSFLSFYEYELFEDENGIYFEYGNTCTRINVDDFEIVEDIID